ncbi:MULTISPECIES: DNA polymerase III subunit alpha [Aerococcus]|uniref:DNA polymerase III subunit alpha n=1 Tax=Aerococcus sanguinicola TaxID=119206 RepID=A0A5N1GKU6_9LACT|nr:MULTISPECIES: DNA polymerase III subunit alpha [Aerococcus]KAA9300908.1 DNA polymerase III subunit alpha [Aerococcus sanguinicola]MDK6679799.1 DNA polymerase III subunit alpha [Aerococcus sp. UMB8608]MDK6686634.1 DNA polymerase III subunit alpha [Aerococcus sp. UMB8623]MDK6939721.1 DNA polymerase III subunit alpha [Aerococcus sp. UMB8487]OFK21968.1 hypothetical protein HMPREF2829_02550 [Aerococcus sp. HMSC072A12]
MFAPLHVNSAYTLLKSPMSLADYVALGKKLGYQALGLADVNVLYGVCEFYDLCQAAGLKALIGLSLQLPSELLGQGFEEYVVYAKNQAGYQVLMQLSTLAKTERYAEALELLQTANDDLVVILSAVYGPHMARLKQNQDAEALAWCQSFKAHFKRDNLYIGVSAQAFDRYHLPRIKDLSQSTALDLVALPYLAYLETEDYFYQELLAAIDRNQALEDIAASQEIRGPHFLKSAVDWRAEYEEIGLADTVDRLAELVDELDVEMVYHKELLPRFPLAEGEDAQSYLGRQAARGLAERLGDQPDFEAYQDRLAYELQVIHRMGFDDYFLIVWDIMRFARASKITVGPGRGSAAGSLVAYALFITHVDPIANDLLFERFLNPERHSMPDIDLDFPDNRRQEVLHYVYEKYGADHVAQIATFGTFAARKALRDVGSALGKNQAEISTWANQIQGQVSLSEAYQGSKDFQHLLRETEDGKLWLQAALKLEGLPRHVSTHAAGVLISDRPLVADIPLQQNANNEILLSQFTMGEVERIGLLKIDFLGLINLSILHDVKAAAEKLGFKNLDQALAQKDDPAVYRLFQEADTLGVFQFESDGIRNVLRQVSPESMEDLAAVNALFRPGPMKQINHFARRKHGQEAISYPHEDLAPILEGTYGVMVYQEQVMQVAQKIAGFSLGQADILRRAMGKKQQEVLDGLHDQFIAGARDQGYAPALAEEVYHYIDAFANYGFNRSHAFAYSYLAYDLAWFKVHCPAAFYYGNLRHSSIHDSKGKQLLAEARAAGIKILLPSVNRSFMPLDLVDQTSLRLGLSNIKSLSRPVSRGIISERQYGGAYKDLMDFVSRLDQAGAREKVLTALALSGALDDFGYNRRTLVEDALPKLLDHRKLFGQQDQQSHLDLGMANDYQALFAPVIEEQEEYSDSELIQQEIDYLGLCLSVDPYAAWKDFYRTGQVQAISELKPKQTVQVIGEVVHVKRIQTKKGQPMAFLELQDASGTVNLTAFPQTYIRYAAFLRDKQQLAVRGKTEERRDQLQVLVDQVHPLDQAYYQQLKDQAIKQGRAGAYHIEVANQAAASEKKAALLALVKDQPGISPLHFIFKEEGTHYWLGPQFALAHSPQVLSSLEEIYGGKHVILS